MYEMHLTAGNAERIQAKKFAERSRLRGLSGYLQFADLLKLFSGVGFRT
jgi:hypothetical protein